MGREARPSGTATSTDFHTAAQPWLRLGQSAAPSQASVRGGCSSCYAATCFLPLRLSRGRKAMLGVRRVRRRSGYGSAALRVSVRPRSGSGPVWAPPWDTTKWRPRCRAADPRSSLHFHWVAGIACSSSMIRRPGSIRLPALTEGERIRGTTVVAAVPPGLSPVSDGSGGRRGMWSEPW